MGLRHLSTASSRTIGGVDPASLFSVPGAWGIVTSMISPGTPFLAMLMAIAWLFWSTETEMPGSSPTPPIQAQEVPSKTLRLWSGAAPLAHGSAPSDVPNLEVFLSPSPGLRPAALILPGGGYGYLSIHFEGSTVARWLQARGISAFVLQYRLPKLGYRYPVPLLDAARALRLIRARAAEWHLDTRKIGLIGFSAGGHLAGLLATGYDAGQATAPDPIERVSDQPDFLVLAYPVVTMMTWGAHSRSRGNLLGSEPDPHLLAQLSLENRVSDRMPPTLLLYALDDPIVPPGPNSGALAAALDRTHVPHQVLAFPTGGHGWGIGHQPPRGPTHWLDALEAWLAGRGLVTTTAPTIAATLNQKLTP